MSTPHPHPSKNEPPTQLSHPSERLSSSSASGRAGEGSSNEDVGTAPPSVAPPAPAPANASEPRLTLDEALRLHHLARYGGGGDVPHRLPGMVLSGGRSMASVDAAATRSARHSPTSVETSAVQILEEAQRIVEEVDASIRLGNEPPPHSQRAAGPRGRSSSSHSSSPSRSIPRGHRSSQSPPHPPEPDRQ